MGDVTNLGNNRSQSGSLQEKSYGLRDYVGLLGMSHVAEAGFPSFGVCIAFSRCSEPNSGECVCGVFMVCMCPHTHISSSNFPTPAGYLIM